ncbi:hypothetical protein [Nostoc sp. 'Lobaria pulmonaria (5183) cyanobiont']|uniref:hypothetical protein n=1 Tax=Nostoc sp. 'Lobaria pulmonaria (5183) cyanobiont' TaxID=1618022 RepID=UPI000CF33148|nr:hypothetical protein [Nostoc sp. 'Lobaria pulmonaria (5183) cyanobiont']AVH73834.1 hypothetical protein NLP_5536 [Nostoc sp. 'Lobaria pulmonaria (5183) cyanobiont']
MNIEPDEDELLNGSPDPSWEYYLLWHRIKSIQAQIEKGLMAISEAQTVNYEIEFEVMNLLIPPFNELKQIITELHPEPYPNRPA